MKRYRGCILATIVFFLIAILIARGEALFTTDATCSVSFHGTRYDSIPCRIVSTRESTHGASWWIYADWPQDITQRETYDVISTESQGDGSQLLTSVLWGSVRYVSNDLELVQSSIDAFNARARIGRKQGEVNFGSVTITRNSIHVEWSTDDVSGDGPSKSWLKRWLVDLGIYGLKR